jgi:sec-independent protein translocase protein TatC
MSDATNHASTSPADPVDEFRMSFGDHLEELRSRSIKALVGLAVATTLSLLFAKQMVAIVYGPLFVALRANGQPPSLLALGLSDPFVAYLKMSLLCGVVISFPWIILQAWKFVSTGLYSHEQRWVRLFGPVSVILFAVGVLFMYYVVLPIVLNFFIGFALSFPVPDLPPVDLPVESAEEPADENIPRIPVLNSAPANAKPGTIWIDARSDRLCVQTQHGMEFAETRTNTAVRSDFGLQFYISLVFTLALAFGIAFELPMVVVFLSLTRILSAAAMAKSRKHVVFGIVIIAAFLTPPDVISQLLLAGPMVLLFEGGLLAARMVERSRAEGEVGTATE